MKIHDKSKYEAHALAVVFPEMDKTEKAGLVESMKRSGFKEEHEIVLHEGKILDGRNREWAAHEAGVKPIYRTFRPADEGSPVEFVRRENYERRHLSASQRAAIAAEMLAFMQADAKERVLKAKAPAPSSLELVNDSDEEAAPPEPATSTAAVADRFGSNSTMLKLAAKLKKKAPDLFEQVMAGTMTVNAASAALAQREADSNKSATQEKERTERRQAIEAIEANYGKEHRVTVSAKAKKIAKKHEDLLIFSGLVKEEGVKLFPLLWAHKWTVTKAQKFLSGKPTTDSSIEDITNFAIAAGRGPDNEADFSIKFNNWRVTIAYEATQAKPAPDKQVEDAAVTA